MKSTSLPKHWIKRSGAYYYRPPAKYKHLFDKQWVHLGRSLSEAYKKFADLPVHGEEGIYLIRDLADAYETKIVSKKAPLTQKSNQRSLRAIREVFGDIPVHKLEPRHCYQYFEANGERVIARRTIEVLRHMCTIAVQWGLLKRNPIKGELRLKTPKPRQRYVTDGELLRFREMCNDKMKAYIDLKLATGLTKEDILCLDRRDIQEDGIHTHRRKTEAKPKIYEWDDEGLLKAIIEAVHKAHKKHVGSSRLFHTYQGKPYYHVNDEGHALSQPEGFNSMWQRLMKKWVDSGGERFTEHDLRAKSASDTDLLHAQLLMDHTDKKVTEKYYRRKPKVVKPNFDPGKKDQ